MKNKNFQNYAFITGASSGIGEQIALDLAESGRPLILVARRAARLKKIKELCLKLGAPDVITLNLDVTKTTQVFSKISKLLQKKSVLTKKKIKVEQLINNAGLAAGVELVQNARPADWDKMLNTNVRGLLMVSRALMASLIETEGHIVNLGSVAGRLVYEGGAVYCATKFAVRALSEGFRMDLKGTRVRVTTIEPGMVETEFSYVRLGNQQKAQAIYEGMMPLSPIDISRTILWCLQQPKHVNVQELVIYPTDQASVGQVVRGERSNKRS